MTAGACKPDPSKSCRGNSESWLSKGTCSSSAWTEFVAGGAGSTCGADMICRVEPLGQDTRRGEVEILCEATSTLRLVGFVAVDVGTSPENCGWQVSIPSTEAEF